MVDAINAEIAAVRGVQDAGSADAIKPAVSKLQVRSSVLAARSLQVITGGRQRSQLSETQPSWQQHTQEHDGQVSCTQTATGPADARLRASVLRPRRKR